MLQCSIRVPKYTPDVKGENIMIMCKIGKILSQVFNPGCLARELDVYVRSEYSKESPEVRYQIRENLMKQVRHYHKNSLSR